MHSISRVHVGFHDLHRGEKKDLVKYFDDMCLFLANHHWVEKDERAVAIRKIIQKSTKVIKEDLMIKHVKLIIEGLANMSDIPKKAQGNYMYILIISK